MAKRAVPFALFLAVATLALIMAAHTAPAARAHGIGTPQLLNVPAGPYMLSAWTDPSPLRADETHVVVAVIDPDTREMIVSGVEVTITMTSLADPAIVLREVAGTDYVNQLLYAAEFNGRVTEGAWRVGVSAAGDLGAGDEVTFEVTIDPARGRNWLWLGIGGMAAVVALWLVSSLRAEKPPRPTRGRATRRPPAGA